MEVLTTGEKEIRFFMASLAPRLSKLRSKTSKGFLFFDLGVFIDKSIATLFGGHEEESFLLLNHKLIA